MKLSCQETLVPGSDLVEKAAFLQASGYEGIELVGPGPGRFRDRAPELRKAAKAGVVMPTICISQAPLIGHFEAVKRREALAIMRELLSVCAEIGGRGVITPASWGMFSRNFPPFTPPRAPGEDREVLLEGLNALAGFAAAEGVSVYLEPLNRYEDYLLNRVEQALEWCREVGSDALMVIADFYHMNIEEADPPAALRLAGARLGHVHMCDSNRYEPGAGHIDLAAHLEALTAIGYEGYLAMEGRLSGPAEEVLPQIPHRIRQAGTAIAT